jgi:hypothetical protein
MKKILNIASLIMTYVCTIILFVPALLILAATDMKEEVRILKMFDN